MNRSRDGARASAASIRSTEKYSVVRISTPDRHEPKWGVFVLCDVSMMRTRRVRARQSRSEMSTRAVTRLPRWASRLEEILRADGSGKTHRDGASGPHDA